MKQKFLIWLLVIAAVCVVVLILYACLLFPWQWEARKNKRAALEYVNATYPDAKYVGAYYRTTKYNPENRGGDTFDFELNGIRFSISTEDGQVLNDFYWTSFAECQLYNTYIKPFTESRNITAEFNYSTSDLQKFFKYYPNADISQYDGSVGIQIYDDKCTDPRSLGWLYDFYCYCKESIPFTNYTVTMIYSGGSLTYSSKHIFSNEDDFYNSFS